MLSRSVSTEVVNQSLTLAATSRGHAGIRVYALQSIRLYLGLPPFSDRL